MSGAVRRLGGLAVALVLLTAKPPTRLVGQVSLRASVGARYSTTLVHDSVVVPFDLRPAIAPAVQLGVRDQLRGPWTADATLDLSSSKLKRHESGSALDVGSFTAIAVMVGLRRELAPGVDARLGFGGLVYSASEPGIFQQGNGGVFPLVSLGATYAPRFATSRGLELSLQYDLHRFITPALRDVGFNRARPVHRIAVALSGRLL